MDSAEELLKLMDGISFREINGESTTEEFWAAVRHNREQLALLEARGDEFMERAMDLVSLFLAESLVPAARAKYGDSTEDSLRRLLKENYSEMNVAVDVAQFKLKVLKEFGDYLDKQQLESLGALIESLPEIVSEVVAGLAGRLKLAPPDSYDDIASILAMMFKGDTKNGDD